MNFKYKEEFEKITEAAHLESQSAELSKDWMDDLKPKKSFTEKVSELILRSPHSERLHHEMFGDGPVALLLKDPKITEVMINDFQTILYEKSGKLFHHNDSFLSPWSFENFIHRMLETSGQKLDLESPFASFAWRDFRVHLSHPQLSTNSYLVSLRRTRNEKEFSLEDMVGMGSCTDEQFECIAAGVTSRKNMLVIGGTGSGKTTTLGAILKKVEAQERIVVLEDTNEISLPNPSSVKLLTRERSPSLKEFLLGDLLRESLRMRPDRLVVGEVRGGEAKDLLMSLSTGHQGSFATLHASSAQEALLRLEMLIQMGAPNWSVESIRKLISLTVNWIVVVERFEDRRRIEGVYELTSLESIGFLTQRIA